ncbi:FkbM family methyltransferase [Paraburkholderia acidiphila]|uniref:FkbM family methyltransferase n=1 Tax=Paraburkholderia acidiphila TaxID=2571747 RepID=A0A7Z2G8K1_9BURK|nr:FkbM family methyltransferase [Paraburkholderia acidiphila]QGZ56764.1 FkbM family methyltransferase [Paraburkholderia acidiphila]
MGLQKRKVRIGDALFDITGDAGYLVSMGDTFEPATLDMLSSMVERDSHVIDVGANIGFTAIALSNFCPDGRVAAVEPVPRTFSLLEQNVKAAHATNVSCHNFALGATAGELLMQGNPDFLAGSFVADKFSIKDGNHFAERVPVHTLDDVLDQTGLTRLDAMKIDVEGFELDVFAGAQRTFAVFEPLVFMEMNHWCLSMFRRMTIPEFREQLLTVFPYVYAVQGTDTRDMTDDNAAYHVAHEHLNHGKFYNLLAGFDRGAVEGALNRYLEKRKASALPSTQLSPHEVAALIARADAAEQRARVFEYRSTELEKAVTAKEQLIWHLEAKLAASNG